MVLFGNQILRYGKYLKLHLLPLDRKFQECYQRPKYKIYLYLLIELRNQCHRDFVIIKQVKLLYMIH
jgi:hypothetical protein